ncbi:MAG: IS66 family insertion sequence element accessory protein TnpB [Bacteroidales bacterium]|nr:IS66 family insertion sequence element accessory protein TnpB [Bacteroidales bacterium]
MFSLSNQVRYYLCQRFVDMRNGANGLYKLVKNEMGLNPVSGDVFIFFSKNKHTVKLLRWDRDGFVLYQKVLETGTFEVPRFNPVTKQMVLPWNTFILIMQGVSLRSARHRKRFRID